MDSYLSPEAHIIDHRQGTLFDRRAIQTAATRQADALRESGVTKGCRVALGHGEGPAFIADLFAIWSLGATALVVSPGNTRQELANIVATAEPRAWIKTDAVPEADSSVPPAEMIEGAVGPTSESLAALDDVALIMMTSGTTSRPKGVMISHRALLARLSLNLCFMGNADLSVSLNVLPMHFGHGLIGNCLTPLFAGATLVAWPEPGAIGLTTLGEAIDSHQVTFMSSVPSLWQAATRLSAPPQKGSLRRVHVGSAPLSADLWRKIIGWSGTRRVLNMYGITECANWIGGENAEDTDGDDKLADTSVGRAWGGRLGVVGADGSVLSEGRGEIAVSNPCLMTGYYEMPEETDRALTGGWMRTGDIGALSPDGRLRLVGRLKHEINRGGIKVPAEEIDLLVERHPDIAEACAFGIEDALEGELIAVAVVARDGVDLEPDALIAWCETRIRRAAVPNRFFALADLPRNARGKLNRDDVRAVCLRQSSRPTETDDGRSIS